MMCLHVTHFLPLLQRRSTEEGGSAEGGDRRLFSDVHSQEFQAAIRVYKRRNLLGTKKTTKFIA
jgi:hypothetical protein